MFDLKLDETGDLELSAMGDVIPTDSIAQTVKIRLKWFLEEWRLGPTFGFPYFQEVFVKNPNLTKIKFLLREQIMEVEGVTNVTETEIQVDPKTRTAKITVAFTADGSPETKTEEVIING